MGAGGCCQGQNVEIKDNTFFRQKTMEKRYTSRKST